MAKHLVSAKCLYFLPVFRVLLSCSLVVLAEAYIIQIQKYDVSVTQAVTTMQTTSAKGTLPTTATATKMAPSVANKKPNAASITQSPKVNTLTSQNVPGSVTSPGKTVTPGSVLSGTKSPISTLLQKSTATLTPGKTMTVQSALQNAALSSVAQTIAGNKVIQVTTGAQLKTVLPGQLRGNPTALIRPAAPGVAAGQRATLPQQVISLQRPGVPGQATIKVNSVAGKTTPAVTAGQGTTPTQYALVRAQIPGTGGGPPQTVTFIRAISPGGQAASGGATVTVTPQQMAALLRGQTTALKGAGQSQVRSVSPSTQGGTTAGLSTIRPVAAAATSQAAGTSSKVPVGKQIIQIAAAQLAASQSIQATVTGSTTSPGVPVVAKVNLAGLTSSLGVVATQAPNVALSNAPSVASSTTTVPTLTTSSQSRQVPSPTVPSSSSDLKGTDSTSSDSTIKPSGLSTTKTTVADSKNVDPKASDNTAAASSVDSTPKSNPDSVTSKSENQATSTQNKESSEVSEATVDSTASTNKTASSSAADSTTSNATTEAEKENSQNPKVEKDSTCKSAEIREPAADAPVKPEASQDLSSIKAEDGLYMFHL